MPSLHDQLCERQPAPSRYGLVLLGLPERLRRDKDACMKLCQQLEGSRRAGAIRILFELIAVFVAVLAACLPLPSLSLAFCAFNRPRLSALACYELSSREYGAR